MPCPRGRGSTSDEPLRVLPSSTKIGLVYQLYSDKWECLANVAVDNDHIPRKLACKLKYVQFRNVWRDKFPQLKISTPGTDFCDFCVTASQKIKNSNGDSKSLLKELLVSHKQEARTEYQEYKKMRHYAEGNTSGDLCMSCSISQKSDPAI